MRFAATLVLLCFLWPLAAAAGRSVRTAQDSVVHLPDASGPRPALILLPFTGGDAQRLHDWRYAETLPALARELGLIVVVPQGRGRGDDYATGEAWNRTLQGYSQRLAADADEIVRAHGADPKRIVLAGYSMGGDLAWALPQRDPERYAGAVVMGSRASFRAKGALERLSARGFHYFMFMGEHEEAARKQGMDGARVALVKANISFENAAATEGHIPAPPEVFDRAVRYALGVAVPPAQWLPATASLLAEVPPPCNLRGFRPTGGGEGFRDAQGRIVIPPQFSHVRRFVAGFAEVLKGGSEHGHVDCSGRFIANEEPGDTPFSEGLARSRRFGWVGYVNYHGEPVIPARFEAAGRFCHGVAEVGEGCTRHEADVMDRLASGRFELASCRSRYFINLKGERVDAPAAPYDPEACDGQRSTIQPEELLDEVDLSHEELARLLGQASPSAPAAAAADAPAVPTEDDEEQQTPLDDAPAADCALEAYVDEREGAFPHSRRGEAKNVGFKDASGRMVISPRFTDAEDFEDGLGVAYIDEQAFYVDCQGKTFEVLYDDGVDEFSEGLVRFPQGESIGYRDRQGKVMLPARYGYGSRFCEGLAKVGAHCRLRREDGAITDVQCTDWQYIDRQGRNTAAPAGWACEGD